MSIGGLILLVLVVTVIVIAAKLKEHSDKIKITRRKNRFRKRNIYNRMLRE